MPSPTHPPTDTGAIGAERSVLEGLLARVEAATGPVRHLDMDLAVAFTPGAHGYHDHGFMTLPGGRTAEPDYLTASLDAALALKSRVLPGHAAAVGDMAFGGGARLPWGCIWNPGGSITGQAEAKTPALALLAAMLRALIAQAPSPATTPTGVLETSLIGEGDSAVAETARTGPVARPETNPLQVDQGEDR